jgi:NAD(P)-dependent dehydrogenase (short-subunit alcohol dehydrogenase family)
VGEIDGIRALITGGGRGIGRAIALSFSANGGRVAVAARTVQEIEQVAHECGEGSLALPLDVSDQSACVDVVRAVEAAMGGIDVLVNAAGVARSAKFTETTNEMWETTLRTDLTSAFWLIGAALPGMLERHSGAVISIASSAARVGRPYVSAYTAAKHGLLGLTRALAAEYAGVGVTFNCVCPAYTDTRMTDETVENIVARTGRTREQAMAALLTPQGRLIAPDEVAAICLLLASPHGRSITGQGINVDGGKVQS